MLHATFCYAKTLFGNHVLVVLSVIWGAVTAFLFPDKAFVAATVACTIMILLDLVTKLYSLSKQAGGFRKACKTRVISSSKLLKGTSEKFLLLLVMMCISGCAYLLSPSAIVAIGIMQAVCLLMFLRDALSILENFDDAGMDVGLFKRFFKKKMDDCIKENIGDAIPTTETTEEKTDT